jgi:tetratricopeptide (TPR) repeat protein
MTKLAYALHQGASPARWDEAEALFDQALTLYRRLLGADHRDIASCLHNYGWLRYRQQRLEEADAFYGQSLDMLRRLDLRADPFYAECLYGYVFLLNLRQRPDEALSTLEEAIPLIERQYGRSSVINLYWQKARAESAIGKADTAAQTVRQGFMAVYEQLVIDHPGAADRISALRWRLMDTETDIRVLADDALSLIGEFEGDAANGLIAGIRCAADLLAAVGRGDEADSLRNTLAARLPASQPASR